MPSTPAVADEIVRIESEEDLAILRPSPSTFYKNADPIVIKGVGRLTVFGLSSQFNSEFPPRLTGKLAPEELKDTMNRINSCLEKNMTTNMRWLACGLIFCCCSFGISLWPVICLNRRTVSALEKTLDHENQQLYNRLNLNWRLARYPVEGSSFTEYVLILEILPKMQLSIPD